MNTPAITTAQRINAIHKDLEALLYKGIEKAIEIGQLLTEKKAELKHGEFGTWISENLIFTDRTARNYMRLFENKDKDKALEAGNISEAYKMLGEGKTETVSDLTEDGLTALLVKMDDDIKYLKSCFSYLNRNPKTKLFPVPPDIVMV